MRSYCASKVPDAHGDHLVHFSHCYYIPEDKLCHALGQFADCQQALEAARKVFAKVNGCRQCVRECHQPR